MERYNHLQPSLGMRSALTKGLALTSAGTPNATNMADAGLHLAPCGVELKPCLHSNKTPSVSSATQAPPSSKKAVFFAQNVNMKIVPHKAPFPSNETWYSLEEERQFMEEAMAVVKLRRHCASMSENDFEKTHNESTQGLEHYLSKRLFSTFKGEQEAVIAAIPLFQEKMKVKGLPIDGEALSRVSQALSATARERAYQKGLQHARSSRPSQDTCDQTAHLQRQRHQRGQSHNNDLHYFHTHRTAAA